MVFWRNNGKNLAPVRPDVWVSDRFSGYRHLDNACEVVPFQPNLCLHLLVFVVGASTVPLFGNGSIEGNSKSSEVRVEGTPRRARNPRSVFERGPRYNGERGIGN
jgi:hypothetical protein